MASLNQVKESSYISRIIVAINKLKFSEHE